MDKSPRYGQMPHLLCGVMRVLSCRELMGRNVRFGSKAAATAKGGRVRFTPKSGHERSRTACPLWAISGLTQCNKSGRFEGQNPRLGDTAQAISGLRFHLT
jgi:hypothetical protein